MFRQDQEIRYGIHSTHPQFMSDKDFSVNVQSTSQIIPVTTQTEYVWGRNHQSVLHFTEVHSKLFINKLDMSYLLLHHHSWKYTNTSSGIYHLSTTNTFDYIYSHSDMISWKHSIIHTANHMVYSPDTMSPSCTQYRTFWLDIFLCFVLCILFLTTVQCWYTI